MKGLENQAWLWGLIGSNVAAIIMLWCAVKRPPIARLLFFLLFAWACFVNWKTSLQKPTAYLEYADLAFIRYYKDLIIGWFSQHISLAVGFIATSQGLIAISMLFKGWEYKLGCLGGFIFMLAIAPLGVGSGFPSTLTFATALIVLYRKGADFLWTKNPEKRLLQGDKSSNFMA